MAKQSDQLKTPLKPQIHLGAVFAIGSLRCARKKLGGKHGFKIIGYRKITHGAKKEGAVRRIYNGKEITVKHRSKLIASTGINAVHGWTE